METFRNVGWGQWCSFLLRLTPLLKVGDQSDQSIPENHQIVQAEKVDVGTGVRTRWQLLDAGKCAPLGFGLSVVS